MQSFLDLNATLRNQPAKLGALLSAVDVGRGREQLFRNQVPQVLAVLAEQTRVESIRASTAIEGYDVPIERAVALSRAPAPRIRNRNEREFAGYRDAVDELSRQQQPEAPSLPLILYLHRRLFAHSGGRGGYFKTDVNLIVGRDEDGKRTVIFEPPGPEQVEHLMRELVVRYETTLSDQAAHPLILLACFILDFLAIHPVADGNGRLARILTMNELLRGGYEVARYVSIEQRIFESKNRYYQALKASQRGWHEATHDIWPWVTYLVQTLADATADFEQRVLSAQGDSGKTKQEILRAYLLGLTPGTEIRVAEVRAARPGISDATFRLVAAELQAAGELQSSGRGRSAHWTRLPRQ